MVGSGGSGEEEDRDQIASLQLSCLSSTSLLHLFGSEIW